MRVAVLGASVAMMAFVVAPMAWAKDVDGPQEFLTKAIQGDNSEVELGRLAASKGVTKGVREYGNRLAEDHAKARREAERVAHNMGITAPREPAEKAQREYDKLQGLSGRDFDEEFLRYMVDDHREDIKDFREQEMSDNREVARLARQQLPTLEGHLRGAQQLMHSREERRRG